MTDSKTHILEFTPEELTTQLAALGMAKFRAKQIHEWIFQKRATSFAQMTNIGLAERTLLEQKYAIFTSEVAGQQTSADGTLKILLRWPAAEPGAADGGLTEAVMIPCDDDRCDEYGNTTVAHRRTACLSTQVGCPVGCAFCASGLAGLKSNLTLGQVVEEALRLMHLLPAERRVHGHGRAAGQL